jgi:4-hydroxybenzoate polyprenyltransferase
VETLRIHILILAALTTLTFGWLLTGEHLWPATGIAAFDWLVAGSIGRTVDVKEDEVNRVPGAALIARNRMLLRVFAFAVLCVSFGVFHAYEPTLTLVRFCFHLLAIVYSFPLLPGRMRLKQIYIVKNVAACLGFLLTGFAYPLAKAHWGFFGLPVAIETMTLLAAGAFLFLFGLAFEIMLDLATAPGDAAAGIESFPVVLGPELSITIIDRLLAFAAIVLVVGFATHFVPWRIVVMSAGPVVQLLVYKRAAKRGLTAGDAMVVAWLLSLQLAVYHLWVWLRLPGLLI